MVLYLDSIGLRNNYYEMINATSKGLNISDVLSILYELSYWWYVGNSKLTYNILLEDRKGWEKLEEPSTHIFF